jgi:hypothetical protein
MAVDTVITLADPWYPRQVCLADPPRQQRSEMTHTPYPYTV